MAFSSKEIQEHIRSVSERQPAVPTRRPSLDDYDRMSYREEPDLDELDEDGWD